MLWAHRPYNPALAKWPEEPIGRSNPTTAIIEHTPDAPVHLGADLRYGASNLQRLLLIRTNLCGWAPQTYYSSVAASSGASNLRPWALACIFNIWRTKPTTWPQLGALNLQPA
jgi:hypothetical protein